MKKEDAQLNSVRWENASKKGRENQGSLTSLPWAGTGWVEWWPIACVTEFCKGPGSKMNGWRKIIL